MLILMKMTYHSIDGGEEMIATKDEAAISGAFMKEFWAYIKKYYTPEPGDHWFNAMCDEANDIAGRNTDCPFAVKLLCAFIRFQADIVNEMEKQEGMSA